MQLLPTKVYAIIDYYEISFLLNLVCRLEEFKEGSSNFMSPTEEFICNLHGMQASSLKNTKLEVAPMTSVVTLKLKE